MNTSYHLWSLWDMLRLNAKAFTTALVLLGTTGQVFSTWRANAPSAHFFLTPDSYSGIKNELLKLRKILVEMDLPMSLTSLDRLLENFASDPPDKIKRMSFQPEDLRVIEGRVGDVRLRIVDEMSSRLMFTIPKIKAAMFDQPSPLFGNEVESKFAQMSEDISEAGKCLSLDRPTAAVFHLMRVMEIAVRRLGDELGISLVHEKNWQNILNEVDQAIRSLDQRDSRTKKLAGLSSHLYNVKLAWRNEVMHPKQTYTSDEADIVYANTQTFVRDLARFIS